MGRLQASIGLITGTDVVGTVDQLIALSGVPRDRLVTRNNTLVQQQQAIGELTAAVIGVQLSGNQLAQSSLFQTRSTTSSNTDALSVESAEGAELGSFQVEGLQLAGTHATQSRIRFDSSSEALGFTGQLSVRNGGFLDDTLSLSELNDGRGVQKGSIRITDRSGATTDIDLSNARSVKEVIDAINDNADIDVRASTDHDRIVLTDTSGQTTENLKVEEIGSGETAADLGLSGIDVAANQASGFDITFSDPDDLLNTVLSDEGVSFAVGDDLTVDLADGTTLNIDLSTPPSDVQELLDELNAVDPAKFEASISDDGDQIVLTDLTVGAGTFTVADANGANVAAALGIDGSSASDTIESPPRSQALYGVGLNELNGGGGLGDLTTLDITLRDGSTASVDLSAAETIQQVIESINASGLAITAKLDDSRTGIRVRDLSGGTTDPFTISSIDSTAESLGIDVSSDETIVDGQNLNRQIVTRDTLLSSLNQGRGIDRASFTITDSDGTASALNLTQEEDIETVGQLVDEINALGLAVTAAINETGDGISLVDTGSGTETLTVTDVGNGTTATELGIAGAATEQVIGGQTVDALVGSESFSIDVSSDDTLDDVIQRINDLNKFVEAAAVTDENGQVSLQLRSRQGGDAGRFSVDTSGFFLEFENTNLGQDGKLSITDDDGQQRVLTSIDGVFDDEVSGLTLTLKDIPDEPVTVDIAENQDAVVSAAKTFLDQYNRLVDKVDSLTFFDAGTQSVGLLFGSRETLRIETSFSRLLSGVIRGNGDIKSLAEVGFSLNELGKLTLDESRLTDRLTSNPEAVELFFTNETTGFAAKVDALSERIAGTENGSLLVRNNTLNNQIEQNNLRVNLLNSRLDSERERLLEQFFGLESAVAKLQSNQQFIGQIKSITGSI